MADKPSLDPAENFNRMLAEWEKLTNSIGGNFLGSSQFSEAMNKGNSMQMEMRKHMSNAMAKALEAANLPSREDVIQLGERVSAIEGQLARIERLLKADATVKKKAPRKGPKRTRKPPASK